MFKIKIILFRIENAEEYFITAGHNDNAESRKNTKSI